MVEWLLFLYAVSTHELVGVPEHLYPTSEMCKRDGAAAAAPGRTYAICYPQPTIKPARDAR